MFALSFMAGYFIMYSIRSGTKTQDAFKSFLGAGGLAGGAYLTQALPARIDDLEGGLLWGAGTYVLIAVAFGAIYSWSSANSPTQAFSVVIGRVLLGEDFRTPAPR